MKQSPCIDWTRVRAIGELVFTQSQNQIEPPMNADKSSFL
jgi:hypothetical protein